MDFAKALEQKAKQYPNKVALIFQDTEITFSQLRDDSFKLAGSLKKLGVKKGDKAVIYLPTWPEYVISYMALFSLGATVVPLDYRLTMDELVSCLNHSETKLLIAKSKEDLSFEELKNKVKSLKDIILCKEEQKGYFNFDKLLKDGKATNPGVEVKDEDFSIIMYTSGSTGRPKGVLKTYRNLDSAPLAIDETVHCNDKDIMICCLPLCHDGGFVYVQTLIAHAVTVILMERFIPAEFLRTVQEHKATCFWLVPPMYYALLQLKEFEKFDLTSLHWVLVFGAPSSPEMLKRFHQYCPNAAFLNGWGMTETMGPTIVLPFGFENIASIGRPVSFVQAKIVDDEFKELSIDSVGELAVKGFNVMAGYYKDSEATAQVMRGDWLLTGDLARIDDKGFVYIVGRKKEMIKVGGQLVYAPEVEASIHKHPKIAEIAVIGIPDKLRGEVPKAFVVLKEGESVTEEEIRYFARDHLAHFKVPHRIEFRDSIPKTRTGKIDKEMLRKGIST